MSRTRKSRWTSNPQSGSVLVCVIVCLSISMTLAAAVTRSALQTRQQARAERQLRQVELLLEAGAGRAFARLEQDAGYAGEDWRLDEETLPGFPAAGVQIEVAPSTNQATYEVRVTASLPAESSKPVRHSGVFSYPPQTTPN